MKVKSSDRKLLIFILILFLLIGTGMILYFLLRDDYVGGDFEYDNNAIYGLMPGVDRDALLAQMQANADESAIAYSINSRPKISGTNINILFENPEGNSKDLAIEIFDNETGDSIYASKALKEGSYLNNVQLERSYAPGEHEVTVYVRAFDQKSHGYIGEAAAELVISTN